MYPEQLPNGKYKWTMEFKDPLTNKRRRISITLESKSRKAEKQARAILEARKSEILAENKEVGVLTFHEFYQEFFSDWSKNVKDSTVKVWTYDMKRFLNQIDNNVLLVKINRRYLQSIFDRMEKDGVSPEFSNRILTRVKQIFKKAVEYEYLDKNPATHISVKKIEKKIDGEKIEYLEKEQVRAIVLELQRTNQYTIANLVMLLYLTGMRVGEGLALTVDDINFNEHTISITKTWSEISKQITTPKTKKSYRVVSTSESIEKILKEQLRMSSGSEYLFPAKRGGRLRVYEVNALLKSTCSAIGIPPVTSHIFRHSHISMLAELGIPIKAIMDRVGHSDSTTTLKVYSHVTEKMTETLVKQVEDSYATFMPLK
ncbi:site-specific integrase [Streptococcus danieliae]|nr:site-specific integrase [Streptococcus danieliae]